MPKKDIIFWSIKFNSFHYLCILRYEIAVNL